jgi:hypothetical protein
MASSLRLDDDLDSDDEEARQSVENYVGVGISVSFNSKHDDQQKRVLEHKDLWRDS